MRYLERRKRVPFFASAILVLAGIARPASSQLITEYRLPSGSFPLHIAPGPGGMWFTESGVNRVGRIDVNGSVSELSVNRPAQRIVAGPDGNLWLTSKGFLTRLTPDGSVTDFPIAGDDYAAGIAVGPDGNIWFTESGRTGSFIGRSTIDGRMTEFKGGDEPDGIVSGPDGNLWFADFSDFVGHRVGRITPSGAIVEFGLLVGGAPRNLAAGADGNLWMASSGGSVGITRVTPSGVMTGFPSPSAHDIAEGIDGNLWFTAPRDNRIGRISTRGDLQEIAVAAANAQPWGIAAGPDGDIWFTELGAGQIGRIHMGAATDGTALGLVAGRFRLSVSFMPPSGAAGAGHPVALTSNTGYFWFFDPASVEIIVKVVDGCAVNGRTWLFVAGLTNLNVLVNVTDTRTGISKLYVNPQGAAFRPIQDTDAFSTCP